MNNVNTVNKQGKKNAALHTMKAFEVANTKVFLVRGQTAIFATLSEFAAHTAKVDD